VTGAGVGAGLELTVAAFAAAAGSSTVAATTIPARIDVRRRIL